MNDITIHKNPKVMYKFGYTDMGDANQRFSEVTSKIRGFANVPLGRDYIPRTRWSAWFPIERAIELEAEFVKRFPVKNLYTTVQYNGITECRVMEYKVAESFIDELKATYPKDTYCYAPHLMKVYFVMFLKK